MGVGRGEKGAGLEGEAGEKGREGTNENHPEREPPSSLSGWPSVITPFLVGKSSSYLICRDLTLIRHTGWGRVTGLKLREAGVEEGANLWSSIRREKEAEKASPACGSVSLASAPSWPFTSNPSVIPNLEVLVQRRICQRPPE